MGERVELLSHVAVGVVLPGGVAGTIPGLWSSITQSTTEESLLAVNTNLTDSLQLSTNGSPFAGASGVAYQWSSSQAAPNSTSGSIAGSYTVPSQGILLLTVVRGPGPAEHDAARQPGPAGRAGEGANPSSDFSSADRAP